MTNGLPSADNPQCLACLNIPNNLYFDIEDAQAAYKEWTAQRQKTNSAVAEIPGLLQDLVAASNAIIRRTLGVISDITNSGTADQKALLENVERLLPVVQAGLQSTLSNFTVAGGSVGYGPYDGVVPLEIANLESAIFSAAGVNIVPLVTTLVGLNTKLSQDFDALTRDSTDQGTYANLLYTITKRVNEVLDCDGKPSLPSDPVGNPVRGNPRPPDGSPGEYDGGDESGVVEDSFDPNNLTGPAGYGPQGFIQPETMPYRIDFENKPTATAAAQVVTATLTLDPNLDPSTFEFTSFGFGAYNFTIPAGLSDYSTTIDLRPDDIDLLVPVTLDLDQATGVVTVTFQSLDPATMEPPDGINAGFLPVDDAAGDGEGYFTYSVQPKPGLPTGTTISAQASIVFDTNAAILTPTSLNTLDVGNPTSAVAPLPSKVNTPAFTVNWSGHDDSGGSGIAVYNVFVSDNGGAFVPFVTGSTATSSQFQGVAGHTYAFYSVATDNAGNVQPTPAAAQATTSVTGSPTSTVKPLPATTSTASFTVSWSGSPGPGATSITSYEIFVSDDGAAFTPFLTHTTATSATFTAQLGHTYGFYSVATNNLGITQSAPTAAQATTTLPSPPPVPPVIVGEQAIFTRKTNKKGKPTGKPILTGFALDFSAPLNQGNASNRGNYQLDNVTTKKVKKKKTIVLKPITAFRVSYSAGSEIVDLNLIGTQAFPTGGQLTIESGVTGATGAPIGGTTVFAISKNGKAITPSR